MPIHSHPATPYHESSDVGVHEVTGLEDGVPQVSAPPTTDGHSN